MKSKKVIQNIPAQNSQGEPEDETGLSTAGLSLEDLIEKKKLENEAYKKILKSLSINKNNSKL